MVTYKNGTADYIVKINISNSKREKLNSRISNISDNVIVIAGYVTIIFIFFWLIQGFVFHIGIWSTIKGLIKSITPIGIVIMMIEATDHWLSLKWFDLETVQDSKQVIHRMARRDIMSILCWIFILLIFW